MTGIRKMILIEEAELDRLRQKQLRDYDPTLSAMARAQTDLEAIISNKDLTDDQKSALIQTAQQRFNNLKSSRGAMPKKEVGSEDAPGPEHQLPLKSEEMAQATDVLSSLKQFLSEHKETDRPLPDEKYAFSDLSFSHAPITKPELKPRNIKVINKLARDSSLAAIKTESPLTPSFSSISLAAESQSPQSHIRRSKRRKTLASSSLFPKQSGTGSIYPPGKKPRLLFLYH